MGKHCEIVKMRKGGASKSTQEVPGCFAAIFANDLFGGTMKKRDYERGQVVKQVATLQDQGESRTAPKNFEGKGPKRGGRPSSPSRVADSLRNKGRDIGAT